MADDSKQETPVTPSEPDMITRAHQAADRLKAEREALDATLARAEKFKAEQVLAGSSQVNLEKPKTPEDISKEKAQAYANKVMSDYYGVKPKA